MEIHQYRGWFYGRSSCTLAPMKRRTALTLYRFLFAAQILALFISLLNLISDLRSGFHPHLLGYLVGAPIGVGMAVLWYREWRAIEAVSEEAWNRAWFIRLPK
jgi:uncharacterized membrane protein required for colicin V production